MPFYDKYNLTLHLELASDSESPQFFDYTSCFTHPQILHYTLYLGQQVRILCNYGSCIFTLLFDPPKFLVYILYLLRVGPPKYTECKTILYSSNSMFLVF